MRPLTIQIFLPSGDPQGIRVAEITTRTVQVFDVPRSEMALFFDMPESEQVTVYYLFGDENQDSRTQCYVGQTNTKTDTHARYLEWWSIKEGNEAGRFALENGNAGSRPHTPAPLQAECHEVFETIGTLLATLGFPIFQRLATSVIKSTDHLVFCTGRGADALGIYSSDGLTVAKGSRCVIEPTEKATQTLHSIWLKMES